MDKKFNPESYVKDLGFREHLAINDWFIMDIKEPNEGEKSIEMSFQAVGENKKELIEGIAWDAFDFGYSIGHGEGYDEKENEEKPYPIILIETAVVFFFLSFFLMLGAGAGIEVLQILNIGFP